MTPCWGAPLAGRAVSPTTLDGCWWAVELGGTSHDRAVRTWDTPPLTVLPSPASLSCTTTSPTSGWKKNTRSTACPKNPYHRVNALPSGASRSSSTASRWPPPTARRSSSKGQACSWTVNGTNPPLPVWSYLQPLSEVACLAGLIGIPDDDPAVRLRINDSPARHTNAG